MDDTDAFKAFVTKLQQYDVAEQNAAVADGEMRPVRATTARTAADASLRGDKIAREPWFASLGSAATNAEVAIVATKV